MKKIDVSSFLRGPQVQELEEFRKLYKSKKRAAILWWNGELSLNKQNAFLMQYFPFYQVKYSSSAPIDYVEYIFFREVLPIYIKMGIIKEKPFTQN
jgi:hypothetical protein